MQINRLDEYYQKRKLSQEKFEIAVSILKELEQFVKQYEILSIDKVSISMIDAFLCIQKSKNINHLEVLLAIGRYYRLIQNNEIYIHITKYLGKLNVVESIEERLGEFVNQSIIDQIKQELIKPDLLTSPEAMPLYLEQMMDVFEAHLDQSTLSKVLSYNHHKIPKSSFDDEVQYYQNAKNLDEYLKDLHKRKIDEITGFYERNEVWFEQQITQPVIDYVASNQEILSAVRVGNDLYVTKIPYDTEQYLNATSDQMKSYHACHCPFAKEAIRMKHANINPTWCHCSGGFTKLPFEVIFGKELEAIPLELAINNDLRCRFKIPLEGVDYK